MKIKKLLSENPVKSREIESLYFTSCLTPYYQNVLAYYENFKK